MDIVRVYTQMDGLTNRRSDHYHNTHHDTCLVQHPMVIMTHQLVTLQHDHSLVMGTTSYGDYPLQMPSNHSNM